VLGEKEEQKKLTERDLETSVSLLLEETPTIWFLDIPGYVVEKVRRGKREEGRGKREEGRGKREEGRGKRKEREREEREERGERERERIFLIFIVMVWRDFHIF
jgi:hypothetical protein